ncbi:MAG: hypothetical protein WDN67_00365 [Candidatus Moraniibacteriota bacterium]
MSRGRTLAEGVKDPKEGKVMVKKGTLVTKEHAALIEKSGIPQVKIRSLISCQSRRGVCRVCYGIDLGRNELVKLGASVGVVAAQAIGEPGTQLTMRTFHIGGVAGSDITQGLPRVEEIFEARTPKTEAILSEVDGQVKKITKDQKVAKIEVQGNDKELYEYQVPANVALKVKENDLIGVGTVLSEGHIDLRKLFSVMGQEAVHRYIIQQIEEIYATQGEAIHDKHIEVIIRQMLSRIRVVDPGDTILLPGDVVERDQFEEANEETTTAKGSVRHRRIDGLGYH